MPHWILNCPKCKQDFIHSEVAAESRRPLHEPFDWGIDEKPNFPDAGIKLKCPNCKRTSVYKRHQLIYRENSQI